MTHIHAQRCSTHLDSSRRQKGFSLMELMIVVVITGVLAAIAIPTFTSYVQKSRTSEAVSFLGVIKLRQEAYRSEFGQYLQCPNGLSDPDNIGPILVPAFGVPASRSRPFPTNDPCFNTLGAKPDGAVRFAYGWAAGTPATAPPASLTNTGAIGYGLTPPIDHYFIAQARADLDDDGVFCQFELTSFTRSVWIGSIRGGTLAPEPAGWE